MIEFCNVSFSYAQKPVINDFSLKIDDGERVCISGESGSGKTTLLRLITGLEKPVKGSINGIHGKRFSVVFQENRLLDWLNVIDNVKIAGNAEKASVLLERLGLEQWSSAAVNELSGGMLRRVAIARALCADFDILLLDEPFNGLDGERVKATAQLISEIAGARTVIIVTHSEYHAELLGARAVEL